MQISRFFKDKLDLTNLDNLEYYSLNSDLPSLICKSVSDVYVNQEDLTNEDWFLECNKDILFYLTDCLALKNLNRRVPKNLSFVAHKSVINDLRGWFWHLYSLITKKFGEEYVNEGLIIKLYFCMRDDLKIVSSGLSGPSGSNELSIKSSSVLVSTKDRVSVIVAARNYGKYLKECLNSCLNQSVKPFDVIYVDDGSTDNSVKIARSVEGINVISLEHKGVCAARNIGVDNSCGNILIHVDGDDLLTYTFIEEHLKTLNNNPDAPFVYGPAQRFGLENYLPETPEWGDRFLWDQNFCNSSSAIRRVYFEAAGGWKECIGGIFWDWNLFLRMSRYNKPVKSNAVLLYRRHSSSVTLTEPNLKIKEVRQQVLRLSIGCVYSGRLPKLLLKWITSLITNVKKLKVKEPIDLVVIDNSNHHSILSKKINQYSEYFKSVKIIRLEKRVKFSDKNGISTLLAEAYMTILKHTLGEVILFLEDDITFSKATDMQRLLDTLTYQSPVYAAVSGSYRNRHCKESLRVAGYTKNGKYSPVQDFVTKEVKVDVAGTGCLMFWRDLAPKHIEPFIYLDSHNIAAHDWWFTANMPVDRHKILCTDVKLKHWLTHRSYYI